METEIVRLNDISNREFFDTYARPGQIGLVGGTTWIDKAIRIAERHVNDQNRSSRWSHAFVIGEQRSDGHLWVIESDLQIIQKHVQLGAQENRLTKYHDEKMYESAAILDFGLPAAQVAQLLREGLELVANRAKYSLREIFGTLLTMRHPQLRGKANLLAREQSYYCSALVRHLYDKTPLNLAPAIDVKNTTPEHLFQTAVPHVTYLLDRTAPKRRLVRIAAQLRHRVKTRLKKKNA